MFFSNHNLHFVITCLYDDRLSENRRGGVFRTLLGATRAFGAGGLYGRYISRHFLILLCGGLQMGLQACRRTRLDFSHVEAKVRDSGLFGGEVSIL